MEFSIKEWSVIDLIKLYNEDKLNLTPPYQRNFIWSKKDQSELIDSILKKRFPLPTFFLHQISDIKFDMVDGQQRTRTILAYYNQQFAEDKMEGLISKEKEEFEKFTLSVTIITSVAGEDTMEEFYARVNKTGKKLNKPELAKAEYFYTNFLKLNESLADNKDFQSLGLFTDASTERMNDIDFISELVALMFYGESDKKEKVETLYQSDISKEKAEELRIKFHSTIDRVKLLDNLFPIKKTRYKQRNDFYTLYSFVTKHGALLNNEQFKEMYKVLISIAEEISPSNDLCDPLKDYAINCVSQSNSKKARKNRLQFFEELLLNKSKVPNKTQQSICEFYEMEEPCLVSIGPFNSIDYHQIFEEKEISL